MTEQQILFAGKSVPKEKVKRLRKKSSAIDEILNDEVEKATYCTEDNVSRENVASSSQFWKVQDHVEELRIVDEGNYDWKALGSKNIIDRTLKV